jgi:hypothetical protein
VQHPSPRYISAVARNLAELQRAIENRNAMVAIEAERATRYPLLRLAYLALFNDYMAHAMKVFEQSTRVASFWYLFRTDQRVVETFTKRASIDIASILEMSARLKQVRDATHFHIDADSVSDTKRIWLDAGIKGVALARAIDDAWEIVCHLQQQHDLPSVELMPATTKERLREQVRRIKL